MVNFFIERPIFSTVLSILMVVAGGIAYAVLPVSLFPDVVPPQVKITSYYTGAGCKDVAQTVSSPIEQNVNGIKGMIYASSNNTDLGASIVTVTFDVGYDLDIGAVDTQNKVEVAKPTLPEAVKQRGVEVVKASTAIVHCICLYSPKGTYDAFFLGNYADLYIKDSLKRVGGMGDVSLLGLRKYSMRIWLDHNKLQSLKMSPLDVANAIRQENKQVAAGKIGQSPIPKGQAFEFQISTEGRMTTAREFEEIIVRSKTDGGLLRLKDVARVELGGENYETVTFINGKPSATLITYQLPGSNALNIADATRKELERLKQSFPEDVDFLIGYDSTNYIKESIHQVQHTFVETVILVILVVFLFLQGLRATLIPLVAVPVAIIATFAVMLAFGFTINTLTLFGLLVAVALVVDDAIVVVENMERLMEHGETDMMVVAKKAMAQVTSPIIATTFIMMAVFVPVAFMPGMTGRMYNQFALTIAISFGFSAINSLTLSPALARLILKHRHGGPSFFLFRWFNAGFAVLERSLAGIVRFSARLWILLLAILGGVTILTATVLGSIPTGFLPEEDQGYVFVNVQAPDGASLERTEAAMVQAREIMMKNEGMENLVELVGFSLLLGTNKTTAGTYFAVFKDWKERKKPELQPKAIMAQWNQEFRNIKDARIFPVLPPPIVGLAATGGSEFVLQDKANAGTDVLVAVTQKLIAEARNSPEIGQVFTTFTANVPHLRFDLDRTKCRLLSVPVSDAYGTLETYLGTYYINDFTLYGKSYKVMMQGEAEFRDKKEDILKLEVRNSLGKMVPLSAVGDIKFESGPDNIERYNLFPSVKITIAPNPGYSSGQVVKAMESLAANVLPDGFGYEWTGTTYQELKAGNAAILVLIMSLLVVYLLLAAQYESWLMPFSVLFSMPFGVLGAGIALKIGGLPLDLYGQIGLVVLIGLIAKNAILIVEFAVELQHAGKAPLEAAVEAARLRLRPIMMTALALILGVIPLMLGSGAGATSRVSLGTTLFGGMVVGTFLGIMTVPVFYYMMATLGAWFTRRFTSGGTAPAVDSHSHAHGS